VPASALPRLGRPRDWLIGAALLVGLFIAVDKSVGWATLLSPWLRLSPWLLLVAFVLTALSYLLRAVRVYDFFGAPVRGRFITVLRLSVLHNTANNLLPMRTGEMLFPWLMRRYFGHGFLAAGASLLWIRLMDLHVLGLAGLLVLVAARSGLALAARGADLDRAVAGHGQAGRLRRWQTGWAAGAFGASPASWPSPVRPDQTLIGRLYLWTALTWLLKLAAFAAVLRHFLAVDFWKVLAGVLGAELSSVLPFHGIAGAGSYELATVAAMLPFGVSATDALTGAVNLHLFVLGTTLILGLFALLIPRGPIVEQQAAR
jgi:uncharacterized membrane protein YbhN (UPF0104 family)